MEELEQLTGSFLQRMREAGHRYRDPIYTLLFLTATHLPFIRLTKEGLYLIKEQKIVSHANNLK